jgi:hypothetical protein
MSGKTIQELVELASEGDEDAAAEITARFAGVEQKATGAERKLKLTTDKELHDRYPRALRAWKKGYLDLDSTVSDEQLVDVLRGKENELADLGAAVEMGAVATPATENATGDVTSSGAQALTGGNASSGPAGSPRDVTREFFDALKGSTEHDQARAFSLLVELNQTKQSEKIQQITRQLEARPITPTGI